MERKAFSQMCRTQSESVEQFPAAIIRQNGPFQLTKRGHQTPAGESGMLGKLFGNKSLPSGASGAFRRGKTKPGASQTV